MRIDLSIKEVEDPIFFFLVFNNGILVQVEVLPAEPDTHLNTSSDWLWDRQVPLVLVISLLNLQLEIVSIPKILIILNSIVRHSFTTWLISLMVSPQCLHLENVLLVSLQVE